MEATERTCELCGDPIDADQAWMQADAPSGGTAVAHSGCVYRDEDPAGRDRWMPPEAGG